MPYLNGGIGTATIASAIDNTALNAVDSRSRRGTITMGLVWVSMVASFPSVLIGLGWHKQGFSLTEVLFSLLLCITLLLAYSIPICILSAKTGLSFKFLCHKYLGPNFSKLLTFCVLFLYLGWYAVVSLLMADATCAIIGSKQYIPLLSFIFCFAMALNNFFGFTGVANFARFIGAPAVICWIIYIFTSIAPDIPVHLQGANLTSATLSSVTLPLAFCAVSQSILGFVIWGNEADYWRNSTNNTLGISLSLATALTIGAVIFPLTGWLIGARTGITDATIATSYLNNFAFGKAGIIALLFLAAQYFAANDSNLYAFVHAAESFTKMTHRKTVAALAILAGLVASGLALSGTQSALEAVCALNGVILPTATIILLIECLVIRRGRLYDQTIVPNVGKSALLAWSCGMMFGIITSGIIPGTKALNFGVPILEAWMLAAILYLPLRKIEIAKNRH